jgi:hypothetical protein
MNQSLDNAIKATYALRGSVAKMNSVSWYKDRPEQILHSDLNCFTDALSHSKTERTWIVYFRVIKKTDENGNTYYELESLGRAKVGKGYFESGDETRDPSAGGSDGILETWAAVGCVSEKAAEALEELLHEELKGQGRHVPPTTNSQGKNSGIEWFKDWPRNKEPAVAEFYDLVGKVTAARNVGRENFLNKARYYQNSGADILAEFLLNGGDMRDFFLLFKPRAGKNTTVLLGLSRYVKALRALGHTECIIADFVSQWPSAFSGLTKDIKGHTFEQGIHIGYVDTSKLDWMSSLQELRQTCDLVLRLVSMQSINQAYANECENDNEYEGPVDAYDSSKVIMMKLVTAHLCIIDESDHGMRTDKSQTFLTEFGYTKCVWMSGTDLYALKHKIRPGNHAIYDIIQERIDIDNGVFGKEVRSKLRIHKSSVTNLPFANLTGDELDIKGLSRRQRNLCAVIEGVGKIKSGIDGLARWESGKGSIVGFKNPAEVIAAFDQYYNWINLSGLPAPIDHDHIFWTMPSMPSGHALKNLILQGKVATQHKPLLANDFGSAFTIEFDVNNEMKRLKRTIFITIGRMLRGAKAPWSAVVRWDDYSDFKVGLQLMLRGQNTDKEWFDVYDCNPYRASVMRYDLIRSRSNGKKVDSQGKELYNLVPIYRLSQFEGTEETWEETVAVYHECSVREGYKKESNLDEKGLLQAAEFLSGVDKSEESKSAERDAAAGKEGKAPPKESRTSPAVTGQKDPLAELKKQGLTVSSMLPLLVILSNGNYTEIDTLVNNTTDDVFLDWLGHCGITVRTGADISESRNMIIGMFNAEDINNQITLTARKINTHGIDWIDWNEFNREKQGDVNTPATAVVSLLDRLPIDFWKSLPKCMDPSCGQGNWLVEIATKLKEQGIDPQNYVFYADTSPINVRITSMRLGFDNGFCYTIKNKKASDIITELEKQFKGYMMEQGIIKFDLYPTNPPFQKADKSGRDDDNLWPSFLALGHKLTATDGYMVMITPGSWASLGTNNTSPGSKIRKKYFDTKQTELVDFTIGDHFDVGSTFTGYVIKNTTNDPTKDTVLVFKDNTVVGKFADYPCFSLWYSESEFIDIVKTFRSKPHYDMIMNDPYHTPRAAMPKKLKDGEYSTVESKAHPYRAYHTNAQDELYSKYKNDFHNQWKAVFSYSGSWKVDVTNECSLTDGSMCVLTDNEVQAKSVQSVLQSAPVKFLIDKVFRWGGYYNGLFIRWIPALPMDKIYTEEEVYKLLFTPDQASLIQRLLLETDNKKAAKQQERDDKKAAKALAKVSKPKKIKTVNSKKVTGVAIA